MTNISGHIFATNRPALSQQVEIIPGISDHEIIKDISKLSIPITKPKERKILYGVEPILIS